MNEIAVEIWHEVEPNHFCLDCNRNAMWLGEYYMVNEELWLKAHPADKGMLCVECLEKRLGRALTPDDFSKCPLNDEPRQWRSELLNERLGWSMCL